MMGRPPTTRRAVLELLQQRGPMTSADIAAALGLGVHGIRTTIEKTRAADAGLLHIVSWRRSLSTSGRMAAVWAYGPGADAPEPAPLTRSECMRRWRRRRDGRVEGIAAPDDRPLRGAMNGIGHIVFAATHPPARTVRELLQALRGHVDHQAAAVAQQP